MVSTRTVGEVMTSEVVQTCPDASSKELARLLTSHRISGLPVVDADGKVIGVVSQTDLTRHLAAHGQGQDQDQDQDEGQGRSATAGQLMTSPAVTIHPEQRVVDAARVMERRHIDRLPVVDEEDRLIGITTRRDLLRVFLRTDSEIRADVIAEIAARTPVRIDVLDGIVTMGGSPGPGVDLTALVRAVWRVDGVVGVVNRLTALPKTA